MSDVNTSRRRFTPGTIDYNGVISDNYQPARALPAETAASWCIVLQPLLAPWSRPTIVDLGCGTGRFSAMLAEQFQARVIGVEPAFSMLKVAARSTGRGAPAYVTGRAEALPLRDQSGDIVWLSHVIHHIADRAACVRELRRVIRPRGRILIRGTFGDRLDGFPTLFHFFPAAREVAGDFPTLDAVAKDFADGGFTVEQLLSVPQTVSGSLRELADRTRLRADTTLALLADSEFARCQAGLESAAAQEREPRPIVERLDLVVLGAEETSAQASVDEAGA